MMSTPGMEALLFRIRILTWIIIIGLVISGVTALPLVWELNLLTDWIGVSSEPSQTSAPLNEVQRWFGVVQQGLVDTENRYPFMFYGTDWLAFGHLMIALVFVGALKDPVRNVWVFQFGMMACCLVIPYALFFGGLRGIPIWWRLIDCSFGIFGIIPLYLAWRAATELERRGWTKK